MTNSTEATPKVQPFPELEAHSQLLAATSFPHPSLVDSYQPGTTEPWLAELLCSIVKATNSRTILETGGYIGTTSAWLALTLAGMGGGHILVCEMDPERAFVIRERLHNLRLAGSLPNTTDEIGGDVMQVIPRLPDRSLDLAFIDDDHHVMHVESEINQLWTKMKPGGIMALHDVWGVCDLQRIVKRWGGISIDAPRLGPAGGLGLIVVPK